MKGLLTIALGLALATSMFAGDHRGSQPRGPAPRPSAPHDVRPAQRAPKQSPRAPHNSPRAPRDRDRRDAQRHYDGHHFDHRYFDHHYGRRHPFYFYEVYWAGEPCIVNSTFWYDGAGFVIVEPVPVSWCGGPLYIEEADDYYVIMNPYYPGFYRVEVLL